jgi:hypothetical protein
LAQGLLGSVLKLESGVGTLILDAHAALGTNRFSHDALRLQRRTRLDFNAGKRRLQFRHQLRSQHCFHGALAKQPVLGQPDTVSGENACERMDEHLLHSKRIRNEARMLPACAAETDEHVSGDIVASCDGDLLDGVCDVVYCYRQKACGNLMWNE